MWKPRAVYLALTQTDEAARQYGNPERRMNLEEILLRLSRFILQGTALILGSLSIVFLWISCYESSAAAYAIFCLATASGIVLWLPPPPAARTRKRS